MGSAYCVTQVVALASSMQVEVENSLVVVDNVSVADRVEQY